MKIKRIRNLKNSIENLLFVSVLLTVGCILSSLLYLAFNLINATLFALNLWAFFLISDVVLFAAKQGCDIWIWRIKTKKQRKVKGTERISPIMFAKGFFKALAYYCF